jgi:glycosyltransferase involved in cell wall biosynthesis
MSKKVLRIINRFNLGGPTYNAAYLTRYLGEGYETLLIGGMRDETEESSEYILKDLGVDYRIIPEMRRSIDPFQDLKALKRIKNIIREFRPDIVHTHAAKAGAIGRRAAFGCKVPVTVHTFHGHVFHSYFGTLKTALYKKIERGLAKRTSAIIAISEKQKEELTRVHRICDPSKTHVIPLGFDLLRFHENFEEKRAVFRKKHTLDDNIIAIGIVGRLVPVKNHRLFLEAIAHVKQNCSLPVRAFIIGDGEERQPLEAAVQELGLSGTVVFTSWEKQVDQVYPGLDIVCLTSFNEGTPVSLIEAQAANRPIVSTKVGGIENIVLDGKNALLSNPDNRLLFFEHLLKVVADAQFRAQMSQNGWEHVREKFHYTRLVKDAKALYETLLT